MKRRVIVVGIGIFVASVWGCAASMELPVGDETLVCMSGAQQCAGSTARVCVDGLWQEESCAGRACVDGACRGACEPGKTRCDGLTAQTCTDQGEWPTGEVCPYMCTAGMCTGECAPNEPKHCAGTTVVKCAGGTWVPDEVCPNLCTAAMCTGECVPGTKQCSGNTPQTCDANGHWQDSGVCSATAPYCKAGTCTIAKSCADMDNTCGPTGTESCCAEQAIPGGSFNRSNMAAAPATVSSFWLDRFEITVGRYRKFVEAYPGSKPAPGAGAHPFIPKIGWDAAWDAALPVSKAALQEQANCSSSHQTWTDIPGANENLPMNCISWYDAFAFCVWDGGRLPTEAEWNYAAAGGAEQREYPWSVPANSKTIDGTYAVYDCRGDGPAATCSYPNILKVGSKSPKGDGRWGHADLGGSMWEWTLDDFADYSPQCNNCVNTSGAPIKAMRGGDWSLNASYVFTWDRNNSPPDNRIVFIGARCARNP